MTRTREPDSLTDLVTAARAGDVAAYGRLVQATQAMSLAVAASVLRDPAGAEDAVQEAYLRAYRRLGDLQEPGAFPGWLRRIVLTAALNLRRVRRVTLLDLDDVLSAPVLDESETRWSDAQRHRLAAALLTLSAEERRICDRRYHGGWSLGRLAEAAGMTETTMRKRLQRIRSRLRQHIEAEEIEMVKQRGVDPEAVAAHLPGKIVELLASPRLTDIPENPVGQMLRQLRAAFPEFTELPLPEIVDLREAVAKDAMYLKPSELHRVDANRILRYDLTLPLLLTARYEGQPIRVWSCGKVYRVCEAGAKHLEAFHQLEVLWLDERERADRWQLTGRVLESVERALPGRSVKIVPVEYPMCERAWELEIDDNGKWMEVLAWGVFADRIVAHLGGDPSRHVAMGVGYGLERLAMLRHGIDDIRKIDVARVA
ncbi:MAG TPA: sigma-70 family RNA polymerase sigma factor [Steroidobacteraceae bacterium]|nr:sigma-70 family RNA polymerase sigma factor [Steroidobacteraceae bacterium]